MLSNVHGKDSGENQTGESKLLIVDGNNQTCHSSVI